MHVICGMHRSGTSLVAKLFHDAGADMGDSRTFHASDRWNPDGYYEQHDIIALNIALLNGAWGKLAYMWLPRNATILRRGNAYTERIAQCGQAYADKIVKENRFCLTLPAWRANGGDVRKVLICLREPANVASSLRLRNRPPLWYAFRLWYAHLSRLLENCAGLDMWYVRYENLLDPASNLAEATGALGFLGVDLSRRDVKALLGATIKRQLSNPSSSQSIKYPHDVQTLWFDLQQRHARQQPA